jgi:hypothetical protein
VCHARVDPHYTARVDPRFERILKEQQSLGFPGLSGSTVNGTIRIGEALLNTAITAALPADGIVRALTVRPREGNRLEARVTLARPAFLPPFTVELAIERQPVLPADPGLVLRLAGGAGSLLSLASSFVRRSVPLPPGITIDGDRVRVDIRAVLQDHGQAALLDLAREISVTTEPAGLVVAVHAVIS